MSDHDAEWQTLPETVVTVNLNPPVRESWLRRVARYWPLGVVILALLVVAGGWAWYSALRGIEQVEVELHNEVASELWIEAQVYQESSDNLARGHSKPISPLVGEVELLTLTEERAIVEIITHSAEGDLAFRQTRAYESTPLGWQRVEFTSAMMGSPRHLQTTHFTFEYRQLDADAVATVAAGVDDLYRQVARRVGLTVAETDRKLSVVVSPEYTPGDLPVEVTIGAPLTIASPRLYVAPVFVSDEELLTQSLLLLLLKHLQAQAVERYEIPYHWQPLLNGLYLWQLWQANQPLSTWQEETARWIYEDGPSAGDQPLGVLPERYAELCSSHRLWLHSPNQIGIPLRCDEIDQRIWLPVWQYVVEPPTDLVELATPLGKSEDRFGIHSAVYRSWHPTVVVSNATLIDYIVTAYGEERLPFMVTNLRDHGNWETLAPTVLGLSASELEAGWHKYLAEHYHLDIDR